MKLPIIKVTYRNREYNAEVVNMNLKDLNGIADLLKDNGAREKVNCLLSIDQVKDIGKQLSKEG